MSYLSQKSAARNPYAIGVVIFLHILLIYGLITGLAVDVAKKVIENIETVNIEEAPPPKEEPPPPPPKLEEIPPYVPPPVVQVETASPPPPPMQTQTSVPVPPAPPAPPQQAITPPAQPAPPPPPAVAPTRAAPVTRTFAVSPDDYPPASLRAEEEGRTGLQVQVGPDGRVVAGSCTVTQSSGFTRLDEAACRVATRRWRFTPATENGKPVASTERRVFVWRLEDAR